MTIPHAPAIRPPTVVPSNRGRARNVSVWREQALGQLRGYRSIENSGFRLYLGSGRAAEHVMSKWSGIVALACLLAGMTTTSIAQNSTDHPQTFGATAQATTRPAQQSGPGHLYSVAGLTLGSRVQFDGTDYREYKCSPSEQFAGYTWCQKTRQEKDRRGSLTVANSLLHSQDGSVFYVNRFQEPAFFTPNEADAAIRQYSTKIW